MKTSPPPVRDDAAEPDTQEPSLELRTNLEALLRDGVECPYCQVNMPVKAEAQREIFDALSNQEDGGSFAKIVYCPADGCPSNNEDGQQDPLMVFIESSDGCNISNCWVVKLNDVPALVTLQVGIKHNLMQQLAQLPLVQANLDRTQRALEESEQGAERERKRERERVQLTRGQRDEYRQIVENLSAALHQLLTAAGLSAPNDVRSKDFNLDGEEWRGVIGRIIRVHSEHEEMLAAKSAAEAKTPPTTMLDILLTLRKFGKRLIEKLLYE